MATLFNIVAYKIVLLTTGTLTLIFKAGWLAEYGEWWWWVLIVIGFVINITMVILCLLSMFSTGIVRVLGSKSIRLLGKLRLIKKPEARLDRLEVALVEYAAGAQMIRRHPSLFWKVLAANFAQRLCMFSVTYCVYLSFGLTGLTWFDLVGVQVLCALAVDSLPFPGGIGLTELMTKQLLSAAIYPLALQTPAMLLTRGINFYFPFAVCAVLTCILHLYLYRVPVPTPEPAAVPADTVPQDSPSEKETEL